MEIINVISYEDPSHLGVGTTEPFISKCEDGMDYVTKVYDTAYQSYGAKHLINEYVSYKIAKRLKLPIPPANLLKLPNDFQTNTGRSLASNVGFGSQYIKGAQAALNEVIIEEAINTQHFADILFFDQFLLNNDRARNDGNLVFSVKTKKLFIIDHTHILIDNISWTEKTIKENFDTWLVQNFDGHLYKVLLNYIDGHSPFHRIISNITNNLTTQSLEEIVKTIPDEWDIKDNEKKVLLDFLEYKVNNLEVIACEIQKQWPNIVGYCKERRDV